MSLRGRWRQRFNIPRSDPRYREATDEDILSDLLVGMYLDGASRRAADPEAAAQEEAAARPALAIAAVSRLRQALSKGGKLFEAILRFESKRKRRETTPQVTQVRAKKAPEDDR